MGGQAVNHLDDDQSEIESDAAGERPALADLISPVGPMFSVVVRVKVTHGRYRL